LKIISSDIICELEYIESVTRGAGTVYPSGAHEFTPVLVGFVLLDL